MKTKILLFISILFFAMQAFSQQIGDGFAPTNLTDFTLPLQSGLYGSLNPIGSIPDISSAWQHLLVVRHGNPTNNHQLQIASAFITNDRLFFRKIASGTLGSTNPSWIELATRGSNTFSGNQSIDGSQNITGNLFLGKDTETTIISGPTNSGAIQIKSHSGLGGSQNRYLRLGWKDNNSVFRPALSINDDLNVGIGTTNPAYNLDISTSAIPATDTYSGLQLQSSNFGYVLKGGIKQNYGGHLSFSTNNAGIITERIRFISQET
jgi:hypothetical protein